MIEVAFALALIFIVAAVAVDEMIWRERFEERKREWEGRRGLPID